MRGAPIAGLALMLVALVAQRTFELRLSARHESALRARGAVEHGRGHFPLLIALHVLWPLALIAEVSLAGARPGPAWPAWLALLLAAQALRAAAIRALGGRWTVRVWVVPGEPVVRRGPYRWMAHPNYLAVAIELVAAPMLFGAWRTAIAATVANAAAMAVRVPVEARALRAATPSPPPRAGAATPASTASAPAPGSPAA